MDERARVEVQVLADGDSLRAERLARSLMADLEAVDGLEVRFAAPVAADPGAKGPGLSDASLWVSLAASTQAASRVLVAAIRAWVQRDKHRVVRVTSGDRTIEIPAHPSPAQEQMLEAFLRDGER